MTKSNKLDFVTLLIMPVQRIPRYVLLLNDLRNKTQKTHKDYEPLSRAIAEMEAVASFINSSKKDSDLNNRALALSKAIQGYDGVRLYW